MDSENKPKIEMHDRQVKAVTNAVAKLLPALHGQGFTAEAIFEGAVKGGATALLAGNNDVTTATVAELLEDMAGAFRDLGQPDLRVVQ